MATSAVRQVPAANVSTAAAGRGSVDAAGGTPSARNKHVCASDRMVKIGGIGWCGPAAAPMIASEQECSNRIY